jgi:hypothetical protein
MMLSIDLNSSVSEHDFISLTLEILEKIGAFESTALPKCGNVFIREILEKDLSRYTINLYLQYNLWHHLSYEIDINSNGPISLIISMIRKYFNKEFVETFKLKPLLEDSIDIVDEEILKEKLLTDTSLLLIPDKIDDIVVDIEGYDSEFLNVTFRDSDTLALLPDEIESLKKDLLNSKRFDILLQL